MGGIYSSVGLRMLDAKVGRSRTTPAEQEETQSDDIVISPIGIPLIAAPEQLLQLCYYQVKLLKYIVISLLEYQ